ncbi:MAG: hypothetical protein DMG10_08845 [Acidobacteria bacterium]|nr:MAG: hypothetical protein DMG10_08845 [Acidobacteriota bacterium]
MRLSGKCGVGFFTTRREGSKNRKAIFFGKDCAFVNAYQNVLVPSSVTDAGVKPATTIAFTEGPAVDAGGNVYFSDIMNNRILKLAPDGTRSVFREPSFRTNGQTFDQRGRLYHCEGSEFGPGGGRRVTRTDFTKNTYEVLTDRYEGVRYNSPNDICVDGQGRVYFTDPCYGDRSIMEMEIEGVYRIDLDGAVKPWMPRETSRTSGWFMISPRGGAGTACGWTSKETSMWRRVSWRRVIAGKLRTCLPPCTS